MSLSSFINGYITAMLWSSCDDDGEPLDSENRELTPEALEQVTADCTDFYEANHEIWQQEGSHWHIQGDDHAGHDFWLTRVGHGTGFWDREEGEVGQQLTKAAKAFGDCYPYITVDGQITVD